MTPIAFSTLIGKVFSRIYANAEMTELYFIAQDPKDPSYKLCHIANCCEDVWLAEIIGDLNVLIDTPILLAYGSSYHTHDRVPGFYSSVTWTFFHMLTANGYITFRWVGLSNGNCLEKVDLVQIID